jgi:1,2-diacylglycerol 3-alpha-glucosyltransferase
MRVGIFVPYIGNFGEKGFYNSQETGLAKSIAKYGSKVIVYKLVSRVLLDKEVREDVSDNIIIRRIPAINIGTHGLINFDIFKNDNLDTIVCFADIQIIVGPLSIWCRKYNINLISYVGAVKSNSADWKVRLITNIISKINIGVYKRNIVIVKTPFVNEQLARKGVTKLKVAPVGLDFDLMKKDFEVFDKLRIKNNLGFKDDDRILLFIGRLVEEKKPIEALMILKALINKGYKYKMLMVGTGYLKNQVHDYIRDNNLEKFVVYIDKIMNSEIWQLYYISDWFVNLNPNEIFGMAILEAMYYRCSVIAMSAPGPSFIIKDKENGILIDRLEINRFCEEIMASESCRAKLIENASRTISKNFGWDNTAKIILDNI